MYGEILQYRHIETRFLAHRLGAVVERGVVGVEGRPEVLPGGLPLDGSLAVAAPYPGTSVRAGPGSIWEKGFERRSVI